MKPIGIFDSGVGGLTVARAVIDLLPNEPIVYIGDTARAPYGSHPPEQVLEDAGRVARCLVEEFNAKMLVVACNTTASVLRSIWDEGEHEGLDAGYLQQAGSVPIVEILTPGAQALIDAAEKGCRRAGVIATETTIASGSYQRALGEALARANGQVNGRALELSFVACPGFVEFAERGDADSAELRALAEELLAPLREAQVEKLLLGCSHFPFLADVISDVLGAEVELVSSAEATAAAVRRELERSGLSESPDREIDGMEIDGTEIDGTEPDCTAHRWLVSGEADCFQAVGRDLLGLPIEHAEFAETLAPSVFI